MIVMVTDPNGHTHRDRHTGTWLDGVTYWAGTPEQIDRRRGGLDGYRERAAGYRGEDVVPLTYTEVTAVPEEWAAIADSATAHENVPAYRRFRALGITPAIPVGTPV